MTLQDKVKWGARILDDRVPGWRERINLEKLDMCSSANSIEGQLFPDLRYFPAMKSLGIKAGSSHLYGFDIEVKDEYTSDEENIQAWQELTDAWKRELKQ